MAAGEDDRSGTRAAARPRAISAVVLLVVAALLLPVAVVGFWAQRTVVDTDRYLATVGPLADDPAVQQVLGDMLLRQLHEQVDLEQRVADLLPGPTKPLAGPITSTVNAFVERQVRDFLASDTFRALWLEMNRRTQQGLVTVPSGGQTSTGIAASGNQIVLDTSVVAERVRAELVRRGLTFLAGLPLPPQADRQIVLLDAPAVAEAKAVYAIVTPTAQWLAPVVVALLLLAIAVSPRRPRTVLAVGVVLAAESALLLVVLAIVGARFESRLRATVLGPAADTFYATLLHYLRVGLVALLVLGVVLAVAGWLGGGARRRPRWPGRPTGRDAGEPAALAAP